MSSSVEQARSSLAKAPAGGQLVGIHLSSPLTLFWRDEVTSANADEMVRRTLELTSEVAVGCVVALDLGEVRFVDSSGVGAMVSLKRQLWDRQITLRFTKLTPAVHNVLTLTRVDEYLLGSTQ